MQLLIDFISISYHPYDTKNTKTQPFQHVTMTTTHHPPPSSDGLVKLGDFGVAKADLKMYAVQEWTEREFM